VYGLFVFGVARNGSSVMVRVVYCVAVIVSALVGRYLLGVGGERWDFYSFCRLRLYAISN